MASSLQAAEIPVCVWGSITGPDALVNGVSYGTRDYFEYLNQSKGGLVGNHVKFILLDGRYKLDEELKIYRRCVDEERAVLLKGWSTGAVKALREQIGRDQVPFLTQSLAGEVLDPVKYPFIFMTGPTYEQQMTVAIRAGAASGKKTLLIMHPDNEYGRSPTNVIRKSGVIEKAGMSLLDTVEFSYDAQDITAQMLRVKAKNPDLVYLQASTPQIILALRDAAKVGLPASKFIGNVFTNSPAVPEQLGVNAEGFRILQMNADFGSDIAAMKLINAYKAKNKLEKEDFPYMKGWMEGVVMARAIELAIEKNGGKVPQDLQAFRKSIRDQLEGLKDFDVGGIVPSVSYANHQGTTRARIAEIKGGKFVPIGEWLDGQ